MNTPFERMRFAACMIELRTELGLTRADVARLSGLSETFIASCETTGAYGVPSIESLLKLANAFAVTLDELVGREGVESRKSRKEVAVLNKSITDWKEAWFKQRDIIGRNFWHHPAVNDDDVREYIRKMNRGLS